MVRSWRATPKESSVSAGFYLNRQDKRKRLKFRLRIAKSFRDQTVGLVTKTSLSDRYRLGRLSIHQLGSLKIDGFNVQSGHSNVSKNIRIKVMLMWSDGNEKLPLGSIGDLVKWFLWLSEPNLFAGAGKKEASPAEWAKASRNKAWTRSGKVFSSDCAQKSNLYVGADEGGQRIQVVLAKKNLN